MDIDLAYIRSEEELVLEAKNSHWNSEFYRPTFLIRVQNLKSNLKDNIGETIHSNHIHRGESNAIINIRRGQVYILRYGNNKKLKADKSEITINLEAENSAPLVSLELVEIWRDEIADQVWIRDLNSTKPIVVNGKQLTAFEKLNLQNEDFISFGTSHFKFKEVPLEEEQQREELLNKVIGNPVILSNILSHLTGLKELRKVCKFWEEETLPLLRIQGKLSISVTQIREFVHFSDGNEQERGNMALWHTHFESKAKLLQSLGLRHLLIEESPFWVGPDIVSTGLSSFEHFFQNPLTKISWISFFIPCDVDNPEHENRAKLLRILIQECKILEKLSIFEDLSQVFESMSIRSHSLKTLQIYGNQSDFGDFLQPFPNLVEIIVGIFAIKGFLRFTSDFRTEEIVKSLLKNLKILRLDTENDRPCLDSESLGHLANFPISLNQLSLRSLCLDRNSPEEISNIFSLGNLRKLKLYIVPGYQMNAEIKFCRSEQLQSLQLLVKNRNEKSWNFGFDENVGANFPNLKTINILTENGKGEECEGEGELFLQKLLAEENRKHFPAIEFAFISYGQRQSRNFVTWTN